MGLFDFFKSNNQENKPNLDKGLEKTRTNFFANLGKAIIGKSVVDADVLDQLEETLILADVGVETTLKIIHNIEARVAKNKYLSTQELDTILKEEVSSLLKVPQQNTLQGTPQELNTELPYVILVVGVNGVGKTTTIGKLAAQFVQNKKKVVLGAADTFRAAAVEQLNTWAMRSGAECIRRGMNTDPSAVAFEAVQFGKNSGADVVIIDTAGRLHNKVNLMNELSKIKKVIAKAHQQAPHEVLLVLDGSTGQNALAQAKEFAKVTDITALAITKLDGTAKGGVVIGISDQLQIPVKYIGVGEKIEDLQMFDKNEFVESLFKK